MNNLNSDLAEVLAEVLDELAYEIDARYENEEISHLTDDSTFTTFRRAIDELRKRSVPLSGRVLYVESRIDAARKEGHHAD